jgi:hypothetical protein
LLGRVEELIRQRIFGDRAWQGGVTTHVGSTLRGVVSGGECRSTGSVLVINKVLEYHPADQTYSVDKPLGVLSLSLVVGIGATLLETLCDLYSQSSSILALRRRPTRSYSCFIPSPNAFALSLADIVIVCLLFVVVVMEV